MASRKLEDLNVDEVVTWLSSIALDKVILCSFTLFWFSSMQQRICYLRFVIFYLFLVEDLCTRSKKGFECFVSA